MDQYNNIIIKMIGQEIDRQRYVQPSESNQSTNTQKQQHNGQQQGSSTITHTQYIQLSRQNVQPNPSQQILQHSQSKIIEQYPHNSQPLEKQIKAPSQIPQLKQQSQYNNISQNRHDQQPSQNAMINSMISSPPENSNEQSDQQNNKIYEQFMETYNQIIFGNELEQSIKVYFQYLVKFSDDQLFFQHFVENQYLAVLMTKIREMKYSTDIVRGAFWGLEYLLKGLSDQNNKNLKEGQKTNKEQQFIYLLIMLNKQGFITEQYKFQEDQDCAYFANFLKLLIRTIMSPLQINNEETDNKYLSIFFNPSQPTFPLLQKLLKLHDFKDTIIQTSVRLCLLEFIKGTNHPITHSLISNQRLNCYMDNFPFILMYCMYGHKCSNTLNRILNETCCKHKPFSKQLEFSQQILYEELLADLIFLEDFTLIESASINHRLVLFCNTYFYYIGRQLFQFLFRTLQNQVDTTQLPLKDIVINTLMVMRKVMKINSVIKIKMGFREMLRKFINCEFWEYLQGKKNGAVEIDWKNWRKIGNGTGLGIEQYCKAVFFQNFTTNKEIQSQQQSMDSMSLAANYSQSSAFEYTSYPLSVLDQEENKVEEPRQSLPIPPKIPQSKKMSPSSSFMKTMQSYIPTSWSKWFKNELRKFSTILGIKISISHFEQINYYDRTSQYTKQSYIHIMQQIQELVYSEKQTFQSLIKKTKKSFFSRYNSTIKQNGVFNAFINSPLFEKDREELIYYYIAVVIELIQGKTDKNEINQHNMCLRNTQQINKQRNIDCCYWSCVEEILDFVTIVYKCNSLMLIGVVYWYVKLIDFQLKTEKNVEDLALISEENKELLNMFMNTMEKLTYFVMTEGWGSFLGKFKNIQLTIWDHESTCDTKRFSNDIFRDIECDILFFIMLRHIFGTKNTPQLQNISQYISETDLITKQIKIPCKLKSPSQKKEKEIDPNKFMIIDGQYIKFMTFGDALINKKPLCVSKCNVYYEGLEEGENEHIVEIVDKQFDGASFTVIFEQKVLKDYVIKQIKYRKRIETQIELGLRTMYFNLQ